MAPCDNRSDEIGLHDQWARGSVPTEIDVFSVMTGPNAVENRYLLGHVRRVFGSFGGLRILDVGAGLGESSVYFALQGARVTSVDVSPAMCSICRQLAVIHRAEERIESRVASAEEMSAETCAYDVVYAANLLHHLADPEAFLVKVRSWLKVPGLFLSYDPIASHPGMWIYRRMAREVRSPHERPLRLGFLRRVRALFEHAEHREFWFLAQLLFLRYFLVDRIHPSRARYWKLIHRPGGVLSAKAMNCLHVLDRFPLSLPGVRRWAWNMALAAGKEKHEH